MEIMDVYTQMGLRSGETVPRGTKLDGDKYLFGVSVWIVNSKGEYLMQKVSQEKRSKDYPDTYEMIGGAVSAGQTIIESAKREVREELGLEVLDEDVEYMGRMNKSANIFLIKHDYDIKTVKIQKEEVSELKWVTVEEIETMNNNGILPPAVYEQFEKYIKEGQSKATRRSASYILFYKGDKFLLLHRSPEYNFEYSYIGGGIEEGETSHQALVREMQEELTYDLDLKECEYLGHRKFYGYHKEKDYDLDVDVYVCELGDKLEKFVLTEPRCSFELLTIDEIKKVDISGHNLDTLKLVEEWNEKRK